MMHMTRAARCSIRAWPRNRARCVRRRPKGLSPVRKARRCAGLRCGRQRSWQRAQIHEGSLSLRQCRGAVIWSFPIEQSLRFDPCIVGVLGRAAASGAAQPFHLLERARPVSAQHARQCAVGVWLLLGEMAAGRLRLGPLLFYWFSSGCGPIRRRLCSIAKMWQ